MSQTTLTLQSIYPDCVSGDVTGGVKKLEIPVEFEEPIPIFVVSDGTTDVAQFAPEGVDSPPISASSLPPVLLELIFPPSYPISMPPLILSLHAVNSWLFSTKRLQQKLLSMWQPGEGVLYAWVEWIRSAEFLEFLGFRTNDDGEDCIRCVARPTFRSRTAAHN